MENYIYIFIDFNLNGRPKTSMVEKNNPHQRSDERRYINIPSSDYRSGQSALMSPKGPSNVR